MTFNDLNLVAPIQKALQNKGYVQPTPIQEQAIPFLLQHKDLLGSAQTGTGKTAAFAIPIIQHIYKNSQNQKGKRKIRALVVTPTRELAIQIAENFTAYAKHTGLRNTVIFGGVKQASQVAQLKRGVDVLVATPGRLLDLMGQGIVSLRDIRYFVLDEADHMLDMGFIHDIKKLLVKLPDNRQSLFFSATMPKQIVELSKTILKKDFVRVTIKPQQATAELVAQAVYFVSKNDKIKLLSDLILERNPKSVLVFSRTKHGANKIVKLLARKDIKAEPIHGNKSQASRQKSLKAFKSGALQVLVATDIAARGIDVSKLELVVNYDLPNISETYVHRIGRTGRAKESGIAISFCAADERSFLRDIEKLIQQKIPQVLDHAYHDDSKELPPAKQGGGGGRRRPQRPKQSNKTRNSGNRNRNRR
jgi:ATP-dependent RNA helicase RhlE